MKNHTDKFFRNFLYFLIAFAMLLSMFKFLFYSQFTVKLINYIDQIQPSLISDVVRIVIGIFMTLCLTGIAIIADLFKDAAYKHYKDLPNPLSPQEWKMVGHKTMIQEGIIPED